MNRFAFDKWLLSFVPGNVDIINGKVTNINKTSGSFDVTVNTNNNKIHFNSKYIVGADGANSIVRRTFFPNYKAKSYVAIQQYFKIDNSNCFYSCIFDKKTSPSCSWSMIKDNHLIFGGAFNSKNCREKFETQKKRLSKFGFDFSKPIKTEACRVLRPTISSGFCTGKNGIFLIGEAAGFISPSSLEGISSAIKSAVILSNAINSASPNPSTLYKLKITPLKIKLYAKCIKRFFMYNPVTRYIIMRSGIKSISLSNGKPQFTYTKCSKNC